MEKSGFKKIGTKANLIIAAAAGACTAVITQVSQYSPFCKLCYDFLNTI
jgi:hypothetical protein